MLETIRVQHGLDTRPQRCAFPPSSYLTKGERHNNRSDPCLTPRERKHCVRAEHAGATQAIAGGYVAR